MQHLMGIKNCHSCDKRGKCDQKDSTANLLREDKQHSKTIFSKPIGSKIKIPTSIKVASYCSEFTLEGTP